MEYSKDFLLGLYRMMVRIREFEETGEKLMLGGKLPGSLHQYVGEEAIAVGATANLRNDDYITSTHRGHGHMIAKGANTQKMMAELYGKSTGYCKGKGGSMHMMDLSIGVLGANGIVGGGLPIATGAGLGIKVRGTDQVVVAFFGDGGSNTGAFHESLNFCAIYKLPVIFMVENNKFATTTRVEESTSVENISDRAAGYTIPGFSIDGNDVIEVYETVKEAVKRARAGDGPTLIEAKTYRLKGHFVGDSRAYRTQEEVDKFWPHEPIRRLGKKLRQSGVLSDGEKERIEQETKKEMEEAVKFAEESPLPLPEDALKDLFVDDSGYDY